MMYQSCEQVSLPYSYRKRQTDQVYSRSAESAIVEEGFVKFHFRSLVYCPWTRREYYFAMIHDVYGDLQWQASGIIIFITL